ncbi:MAG: type II toxin-antitoxin system HicA family toxin [Turicibacter sp.]|nr:type II toxin-antitoxin system HicA family toxin [Turicibacter sp.]
MNRKQKLINRLKSRPRDMTFDEVETLLSLLGFKRSNQGKTSGSRVKFTRIDNGRKINVTLHRPHPGNILQIYQIVEVIKQLEKEGLI